MERIKDRLFDYRYLYPLFLSRINRVKHLNNNNWASTNVEEHLIKLQSGLNFVEEGIYPYDCLLGISGGKDSTYVLYSLVEKYRLKVLTFTFDNLFLSEAARKNINTIVKDLHVDHFYYTFPPDIQREIYRQAITRLGSPCFGCSFWVYIVSNYLALEKSIPLVIHGREPLQMFKELHNKSFDPFLPFLQSNLTPFHPQKNKCMSMKALQKAFLYFKRGFNKSLMDSVKKRFFPLDPADIPAERFPEFLGYFLYHPYDKQKINNDTRWARLEDHSDCVIHDAAEYMRKQVAGCSVAESEIYTAVRQKTLNLDQAKKQINALGYLRNKPVEAIALLCEKTGINPADFDTIIKSNRTRNGLLKKYLHFRNYFRRNHFVRVHLGEGEPV
jgi:hypothetical protein